MVEAQRSLFDGRTAAAPPKDWIPAEPPLVASAGIKRIALDTETTGLRWWADRVVGIGVAFDDGRSRYLPFGHSAGNLDEEKIKDWARRELRGVHIDFFNGPFDLNSMYYWGVDLEAQGCTVSDVGLWAALLDDHRTHYNLDSIAKDALGIGKVEGIDTTRMADYAAWEVEEYGCRDPLLVNGLREKFWPMLDQQELQVVRQLEDDCVYATAEMERLGAPLDEEKLDRWEKQSERDYVQSLWDIRKETGLTINPGSREDLKKLFEKYSIPLPTNTMPGPDQGKVTFGKGYLEKINHPVIRLVRRARRLASLRSKYLIPYQEDLRRNGVLRYALHQLRTGGDSEAFGESGTISGRYSSSAYSTGDGANIQQVAGKKYSHSVQEEHWIYNVRELFVPASGLWLSGDAEQIEYRLFSHYAQPPKVMEAYAKDPWTNYHKITQAMIEKYRPITYELTKDCNFAAVYGAGTEKFAFMLGMSEDEVKPLYNAYHNAVPEARRLLKYAMRMAEQRGYVRTILGRRARFLDTVMLHASLNRVIQGSAADEMKKKVVELRKERKRTNFTLRFVVHDEANGDVPDEESAKAVQEVLNRQLLQTRVPLLWKVGTGANWQEAKK
jgi:DNA polymerase I-like protein with 3'-5' exonuclease and polymerase domains